MAGHNGEPTSNAVDWLLQPHDPSVRYLALRDLLGRPPEDPDVREARQALAGSPEIESVFAAQSPGGTWGDPATPYRPK